MRWQDSKCINCERKSDMTVYTLLSTKHRKPRVQKTSKAIPLCTSCIRSLKISHVTQVYTTILLTLRATHAELAKQL
jgi:hypothetical protein